MSTADARRVLNDAIARRVFPAAVFDVGSSGGSLSRQALGSLTFDVDAPSSDDGTIFDLASLTKVVATTTVVMELSRTGAIGLDEPVADCFPEWRGDDRKRVTIRDLLEHSSGLPARLIEASAGGRREFEHDICTMPLEYEPRSRSVYSDLGFILLGFLVADRGAHPLDAQFEEIRLRLFQRGAAPAEELLAFFVASAGRDRTAPTIPLEQDVRRGRRLVGEVHDDYAAALGGVAGHAGLFGTASGLAAFARVVLRAARGTGAGPEPFSPSRVREFTSRSGVPRSSRALGWDTMLPTSSCGVHMSAAAFGHVGFTGTSLWIDPQQDRYFVLLTNRTMGGGSLEQIRQVRRDFHDALASF